MLRIQPEDTISSLDLGRLSTRRLLSIGFSVSEGGLECVTVLFVMYF